MKDGKFELEDAVRIRSAGKHGPIGKVDGFIPGAVIVRWSANDVSFHQPVDLVLVKPHGDLAGY